MTIDASKKSLIPVGPAVSSHSCPEFIGSVRPKAKAPYNPKTQIPNPNSGSAHRPSGAGHPHPHHSLSKKQSQSPSLSSWFFFGKTRFSSQPLSLSPPFFFSLSLSLYTHTHIVFGDRKRRHFPAKFETGITRRISREKRRRKNTTTFSGEVVVGDMRTELLCNVIRN